MAYVKQLHDVYRQEIEKTQAEKREVESKAQAGLEELRDKLRALEDQLLAEKGAKVQALNELTYKRIEIEKLQDDFLSKVRDLRKGYEERICGQQKEIIDRDAQIETFNLKIGEYQQKIRDIQRDVDEQSASYGKKVQEKRQEVERLKAMAEKAQNVLSEKEKEVAMLTRQLGQAQGQV